MTEIRKVFYCTFSKNIWDSRCKKGRKVLHAWDSPWELSIKITVRAETYEDIYTFYHFVGLKWHRLLKRLLTNENGAPNRHSKYQSGDVLTTQWARISAVKLLTSSSRNIPASALEGVLCCVFKTKYSSIKIQPKILVHNPMEDVDIVHKTIKLSITCKLREMNQKLTPWIK